MGKILSFGQKSKQFKAMTIIHLISSITMIIASILNANKPEVRHVDLEDAWHGC